MASFPQRAGGVRAADDESTAEAATRAARVTCAALHAAGLNPTCADALFEDASSDPLGRKESTGSGVGFASPGGAIGRNAVARAVVARDSRPRAIERHAGGRVSRRRGRESRTVVYASSCARLSNASSSAGRLVERYARLASIVALHELPASRSSARSPRRARSHRFRAPPRTRETIPSPHPNSARRCGCGVGWAPFVSASASSLHGRPLLRHRRVD